MAGKQRKDNKKLKAAAARGAFLKLKQWIVAALAGAAIFFAQEIFADEKVLWERCDQGIDEAVVADVCAIQSAPGSIYAAAGKTVYKSTDSGKNWRAAYSLHGEKTINSIDCDPRDASKIFALTTDGLYLSRDAGKDWKRVFKGKDYLQRDVKGISFDEDNNIYIGTAKGLFKSADCGKSWSSVTQFINKDVMAIASGSGDIYACAFDGVYQCKTGREAWERLHVASAAEGEGSESDNGEEDSDEGAFESKLNHMIFTKAAYLAADKGVYKKEKDARSFTKLPGEGLLSENAKFILDAGGNIFIVTERGIFSYDEAQRKWHDRTEGLETFLVNRLSYSPGENAIYAATGKGVYRAPVALLRQCFGGQAGSRAQGNKNTEAKDDKYSKAFRDEPGIGAIQKAAIEYAEVSPQKIEWMRRAAKNKAWLPAVSVGFDNDFSNNIDVDRGGTNDRDVFIEGPYDADYGWDINLSWDLGDIIWNDDQTSIDVRSRLMVQLRNDVLDEVTKLYFERRRLQLEFVNNPPKSDEEMAGRQLRLAELTAGIDGLTGGYLSQELQKKGSR